MWKRPRGGENLAGKKSPGKKYIGEKSAGKIPAEKRLAGNSLVTVLLKIPPVHVKFFSQI